MTQWEYTSRAYGQRNHMHIRTELASLGKAGWELVNITTNMGTPVFWFKREMPRQEGNDDELHRSAG